MLIAILSLLAGNLASAAPDFISREGEPIRWKWADGREAVVIEEVLDAGTIAVDTKTNLNSCTDTPLPKCRFESPVRFRKFLMIWDKHPLDPAKTGEVIFQLNEKSERENFARQQLIGQDMQITWAQLGLANPIDEKLQMNMFCDRYDWLPGDGGAPASAIVPAWITHFEEGVMEFWLPGNEQNPPVNHYTANMKQVRFETGVNGGYRLAEADGFFTTVTHLASMLRGYISSFVFDREKFAGHPAKITDEAEYPNPMCEVEFTLDFSQFYQQSNARLREEPSLDYDRVHAKKVIYRHDDPEIYLSWPFFNPGENAQ